METRNLKYIKTCGGHTGTVPRKGQLAVGLAFAFAGILAMFGLVFQSSLNTIDKAKLQTTADYAVLVVADQQARYLNKIRDTNESIQIAWDATMLELQPSFAQMSGVADTSGSIPIGVAEGIASAATLGHVKPGSCSEMGQGVDKYYRGKIVDTYTLARNQAASYIASIVTDSNQSSFELGLDHFLDPAGLPHGMFMLLKKTLGENFNVNDVRKAYDNGSLANNEEYAYEILDANKDDPLFVPKNEPRLFSYTKWSYQNVSCYCTPACQVCCQGPSFGPPGVTAANARVVRATDDTSYFFAGIRYTPTLSIIQKTFGMGVKNPDSSSEDFGKDIGTGTSREKLFRDREKSKRTMMQVMAAAKPFGGSYPEAGFIGDSTGLSGQTGESFKSSKLFGIADVGELEGHRIHRADGSIANRDNQGNVVGELPFYAEDFLH